MWRKGLIRWVRTVYGSTCMSNRIRGCCYSGRWRGSLGHPYCECLSWFDFSLLRLSHSWRLGFAYMGYPIMDAVGSILIGNLLGPLPPCSSISYAFSGAISIFLIRKNTKALLGHSTPPARRQKIVKYVLRDPMVHSIHHVKSVQLGVDSISFNADIEFEGKAVASKYLQKHPEIVEGSTSSLSPLLWRLGIILAKGDKTAVEDYLIEVWILSYASKYIFTL